MMDIQDLAWQDMQFLGSGIQFLRSHCTFKLTFTKGLNDLKRSCSMSAFMDENEYNYTIILSIVMTPLTK